MIFDRIQLEIAPGVVVEYVKAAVGKVISPVIPEVEPGTALEDSPPDQTQA